MRIKGDIYEDGELILSDIDIFTHEDQSEGNLKSWGGSFESDRMLGIGDKEYEVFLSDGRKGKIIISECIHDEKYIIHFSGAGPLYMHK